MTLNILAAKIPGDREITRVRDYMRLILRIVENSLDNPRARIAYALYTDGCPPELALEIADAISPGDMDQIDKAIIAANQREESAGIPTGEN